jgi:energy-converting hydrogenase Eha subunit F
MEQQFKLAQIEAALRNPKTKKEDIITIFIALQHQNFVLTNTVSNLVQKWPTPTPQVQTTTEEGTSKSGPSFGTKG